MSEANLLLNYVDIHRPFCVIAAPPCTSTGSWSHFNRVVHHTTWLRTRRTLNRIASLTAEVCRRQLHGNRHFLVENPFPSDLWDFPEWKSLANESQVCSVIHDQCQSGLKHPLTKRPVRKRTQFMSSHRTLARRLDRQCDEVVPQSGELLQVTE